MTDEQKIKEALRPTAREVAATAWCHPTTEMITLDARLAAVFTEIILEVMMEGERRREDR